MKKLLFPAAAFLLCLSSANAGSITYNSGLFPADGPNGGASTCSPNGTDGCLPASATASFSINGSGQLVVTLTNTTAVPWQDGQNLSAFSFQIKNFGGSYLTSSTLLSITGDSISSTPLNTDITSLITAGGASLATTPWTSTAPGGSALPTANTIAYFANLSGGTAGKGSIVGAPNGSNEYVAGSCVDKNGKNSGTNCGSSNEYGTSKDIGPNIYQTATFVFSISGLGTGSLADLSTCSSGMECITGVNFGFGPDGPDQDDITAGTPQQTSATPEPVTLILTGSGLAGLFLIRRRRAVRG